MGKEIISARENFVRIEEKRVNAALDAISKVGQLKTSGFYEFSEDDIQRIKDALIEASENAAAALQIYLKNGALERKFSLSKVEKDMDKEEKSL